MKTALHTLRTGLQRLYRSLRNIAPVRLLLNISEDFYTAELRLHRRAHS